MIIVIKVDIRMFLEWENNSGKLQIISEKFQNSGKFQNNAINDVKQISLSHLIYLCDYSLFISLLFGYLDFHLTTKLTGYMSAA